MSDKYQLMPIAKVNGAWSVPDELLRGLWNKHEGCESFKKVFYDGAIANAEQWIEFLHSDKIYPVLVIANSVPPRIVSAAWMVPDLDRNIHIHYCPLTRIGWKVEIGKIIIEYWKNFRDADGTPLVLGVLSITPAHYISANKFLLRLGLKVVGVLPEHSTMAYEERRADMTVYYGRVGRDL
mgnify:CR=1 FL=1